MEAEMGEIAVTTATRAQAVRRNDRDIKHILLPQYPPPYAFVREPLLTGPHSAVPPQNNVAADCARRRGR
jgi:hypothetical protein